MNKSNKIIKKKSLINEFKIMIYFSFLFILIPFSSSFQINNVLHSFSGDQVYIEWQTEIPADSKVYYSLNNDFDQFEYSSNLAISHLIILSGLEDETLYNYYVESCTSENICETSEEFSFQTLKFSNGETPEPEVFFLDILHKEGDVPQYYNQFNIDLTVRTSKEAHVRIFVNGNNVRNRQYLGVNTYTFNDLELNQGLNEIEIISTLNDDSLTETYTIDVSNQPPVINLNKELNEIIGDVVSSSSFTVDGSVNEFVYLDIMFSKTNLPLKIVQTVQIEEGTFSQNINLNDGDGRYNIKLVFRDRYGNQIDFSTETYVDTIHNTLVVTNPLGSEASSYVDRYRIQGTTKPGAEVVVYVNDKNSSRGSWRTSVLSMLRLGGQELGGLHNAYYTIADDEGRFTVDIYLSKKYYDDTYRGQVFTPQTEVRPDFERSFTNVPAWRNEIKVVSTDIAGREAEKDLVIILTTCDYGGDWNVQLEQISPAKINPLYVREGVATLSFNYKLEWQGPGLMGNILTEPIIRIDTDFQSTLHPEHELNDEFSLADKLIPKDRLINIYNRDTKSGTVTIRLNRFDLDSLDFEDTFNYLFALLKMEIDYEFDNPFGGGSSSDSGLYRGRQTKCVNLKVLIDDTMASPFRIPWLLNRTKNILVGASKTLEPVIDAATFARRYSSYGAFTTNVAYYVALINNRRACISYVGSRFVPRGNIDGISQTILPHMCEEVYYNDENQVNNCNSCWDSIIAVQNINKFNRMISDRIFCPSIPSVQEYNKRIQRSNNLYYFLQPPKDKNDFPDETENLRVDDQRNVIISSKNWCNDISNFYFQEDDNSKLKRELCKMQYDYEWNSACLFHNNLFNRSFETSNVSGGFLERVTDVFEKFCFKQNTVSHEFIQVSSVQQCILACHPEHTNLKDDGTCEKKNASEIVYFGYRGRGMPCFYLLNPEGHPPGIYYAEYDENLACVTDPNTGRCRTDEYGAIIIDPHALRGRLTVNTNAPEGGSLTNYVKKIVEKDNQDRQNINQREEEARKLTQFGLGYYAFAHINKYIMEPSRTIASTITCGCITGFEQHLKLYKNFIDLGITCMSEIMYDPNSTATTCQRMFAMRLCDLLYEAIKCVGKYYSQKIYFSNERPTEGGGIGNLFAAMDSAGSKVAHDLTDRYGRSAVFDNIFSEKAILNAICMAAFFGDFNAEFDSLFAATEDLVVVDPIIMVFPAQREYMHYLPVNGRANFIYRFNVALVAGADMDYHVYLKCSTGMCGSEPCDCMHLPEAQTYKQTGIQGSLRKYQTLHRDFITSVTADYRYDTVVVRYSYRNSKGEIVEGEKEFPIREIGGSPPLHCQFDLLELRYLCNIEIGTRGYASFGNVQPRIPGTIHGEGVFRLGDQLRVEGEIVKRDVEDDEIQNVFLYYELRDDANVKITHGNRLIRESGLHSLDEIFNRLNLRVGSGWFKGSINVNSDRGVSALVAGILEDSVRIDISGTETDSLTISINTFGKIYDVNGREIQTGFNYPYDGGQGFMFTIDSGTNIAQVFVEGIPRRGTEKYHAQIDLESKIIQARRFVLHLSLHYASENNPNQPDLSQPIFNTREEKYSIHFRAINDGETNRCPIFLRYGEIRINPCMCDGSICPDPNKPELKFCYGGCKEYAACGAVRHVGAVNLVAQGNRDKSKELLKVHQNDPCFCDPTRGPNDPDYNVNTPMYCYVVKDGEGGHKFKLGTSNEFDKDWNASNIVRYRDGITTGAPTTPIPDDEIGDEPNIFVLNALKEYQTWNEGTLLETNLVALPLLKKYWAASGYTPPDPVNEAWSAAFISYITNSELKAPAHATYIHKVYKNEIPHWSFHLPEVTNLLLGDIICKPRGGSDPTIQMIEDGQSYHSHCDIVVKIKPNSIEYIGGNLGDSVKKQSLSLTNNRLPDEYIAVLRKTPPTIA